MMTFVLLALAVVALACALLGPLIGFSRLFTVGLVLSLAVAPYPLMAPSGPEHFGITAGAPLPMVYALLLLALVLGMLGITGVVRILLFSAVALSYFTLLALFAWGNSMQQWSGILHFATAFVACAVGFGVAQRMAGDPFLVRLVTLAILGAVLIQLAFSALQLLGFNASIYDNAPYFVAEGRPIGSFNHPSVLGKILFLLYLVLFPLSRGGDKPTRILAWITIGLSLVATAMTEGRANLLAAAGAVGLWLFFDRRLTAKLRWLVVGGGLLAAIPIAIVLLPRFLMDPEGGDRPELLATGLAQIGEHWLFGLGANSYSEVVGKWDILAATGYPVHNAVLLAVAELGVLGALFVLLPAAVTTILAVMKVRAYGTVGDTALAVLVTVPGLLLIGLTGWGLLSAGTLILWFFVTGIAIRWMTAPPTSREHFLRREGERLSASPVPLDPVWNAPIVPSRRRRIQPPVDVRSAPDPEVPDDTVAVGNSREHDAGVEGVS